MMKTAGSDASHWWGWICFYRVCPKQKATTESLSSPRLCSNPHSPLSTVLHYIVHLKEWINTRVNSDTECSAFA